MLTSLGYCSAPPRRTSVPRGDHRPPVVHGAPCPQAMFPLRAGRPQERNAICLPVPLRRGTWPRPEGQESRRRPVNGHGRAGLGVRLRLRLAPALPPTAGDGHVRTPWRAGSFHAAPIALQSPRGRRSGPGHRRGGGSAPPRSRIRLPRTGAYGIGAYDSDDCGAECMGGDFTAGATPPHPPRPRSDRPRGTPVGRLPPTDGACVPARRRSWP